MTTLPSTAGARKVEQTNLMWSEPMQTVSSSTTVCTIHHSYHGSNPWCKNVTVRTHSRHQVLWHNPGPANDLWAGKKEFQSMSTLGPKCSQISKLPRLQRPTDQIGCYSCPKLLKSRKDRQHPRQNYVWKMQEKYFWQSALRHACQNEKIKGAQTKFVNIGSFPNI